MALDQITRSAVAARLSWIDAESGPVAAKRARGSLSAFYTWAMSQGLTEVNPVIGTVAPEGGEARERTLTDDELTAVWRACKDDGSGRIIRLLVLLGPGGKRLVASLGRSLTSTRRRGRCQLPDPRTAEHTLPLMPMAMEIIRSVPRMALRAQLGERGATGFTGWAACKNRLDAGSGTADSTSTTSGERWPHGWLTSASRRTSSRPSSIVSGHRAGPAGVSMAATIRVRSPPHWRSREDHVRGLIEATDRKVLAFAPRSHLNASSGHVRVLHVQGSSSTRTLRYG